MSGSILVADDSELVHQLVRTHLSSDNLEIQSVYDGQAVLEKAAQMRPNLILLDVDMPRMNGFEACKNLKANPATGSTPIIFLTADAAVLDKVKGLDMGAVDYITKPFKPEELQARVRTALRTRSKVDKNSMIDPLTGLWNRTYLNLELAKQQATSQRSEGTVACIVGEIDDIAQTIDKFGSVIGDDVIRAVGTIVKSLCREEETVCHLGSGRFAILMPLTNRTGAAHLADRIRCEIQNQLAERGSLALGGTCSFGIADSQIDGDAALLDRADAALYRAKTVGRNSVSVSRPSSSEACAA